MRLLLISTLIFIVCICGCVEEDHPVRIADVSLTLDDFPSYWEPNDDVMTYNENSCAFEKKPYIVQRDNSADLCIKKGSYMCGYSIIRFETEESALDYYWSVSESRSMCAGRDDYGEYSDYCMNDLGDMGFTTTKVNTNYREDFVDATVVFIDKNIVVDCYCHSTEYNAISDLEYSLKMVESYAYLIKQRLEEQKPDIYLYYGGSQTQ